MPDLPGKSLARTLAVHFMDLAGMLVLRNKMLPPFSLRRQVGEVGWQLYGDDFIALGKHFVERLVADAGLTASSQVLDLGSGCGRVAIPLTAALTSGGYLGIEPNLPAVRWCRENISVGFPAFRFESVDVHSDLYNPRGRIRAEVFQFPPREGSIEVVVATSIFTHLLPSAAQHYLAESARVLRPGGRLFATFFLLDNGARSHDGAFNFAYALPGNARVVDAEVPERAIAYPSTWLLQQAELVGLRLVPPIHYGEWSGYRPAYSGQDVLILEKT